MLRWCCWLELCVVFFFFSSRRRHTRCSRDWSSDVCSSDLAGSLDVDKLDYLSRGAWMCGVPYGVIDVDRLLTSLTLAPGTGGGTTLALTEKGLAPLESLLFAKYQMYRTVYWHHAVRSATAMFKRAVRQALAG